MITVGITGGSGYVAGELLRCLVHHPKVNIDFIYSHSQNGKSISDIHEDLFQMSNLDFSQNINSEVDLVFLCLGHGKSADFLAKNYFSKKTKIIDLSNDFRLKENANFNNLNFIYGLPEVNKKPIKSASYIANPGCFATAIQIALLPLAQNKLLQNAVHINAITGSTGAGQSFSETSHFSWRNNNISMYKAFSHQHLGEIQETLNELQKEKSVDLNFIPLRGNFTRGIFATLYTECPLDEAKLKKIYQDFYKEHPFVYVSDKEIHLKKVINTNHCVLFVQKLKNIILITSIIDNLIKGAAGQAIQNMNLMFNFPEKTGLSFKSSYF